MGPLLAAAVPPRPFAYRSGVRLGARAGILFGIVCQTMRERPIRFRTSRSVTNIRFSVTAGFFPRDAVMSRGLRGAQSAHDGFTRTISLDSGAKSAVSTGVNLQGTSATASGLRTEKMLIFRPRHNRPRVAPPSPDRGAIFLPNVSPGVRAASSRLMPPIITGACHRRSFRRVLTSRYALPRTRVPLNNHRSVLIERNVRGQSIRQPWSPAPDQ